MASTGFEPILAAIGHGFKLNPPSGITTVAFKCLHLYRNQTMLVIANYCNLKCNSKLLSIFTTHLNKPLPQQSQMYGSIETRIRHMCVCDYFVHMTFVL